MIFVESKRKSTQSLSKLHPGARLLDVTSKGSEPWIQFSPFYPHGNIPVLFSPEVFSETVEGIWQGLKVFEKEDIDVSRFAIRNMKGLKRTVRKYGKPLGHRRGVSGTELLDYITARKEIYVPTYFWVLDHKLQPLIRQLRSLAEKQDVILLDFDTNSDIENPRKPLSHASLIQKYLENNFY